MAPKQGKQKKRKQVVEAEPKSFNEHLFYSIEHQERFKSIIDKKKIIANRTFDFHTESILEIQSEIASQKWAKLIRYIIQHCPVIVHEFYANAYRVLGTNRAFVSYVRGKSVNFTWERINEVLGLPIPRECAYKNRVDNVTNYDELLEYLCRPGAEWFRARDNYPRRFKSINMKPITKAWSAFVHQTVLLSSNSSNVITHRAQFIAALMKGEDINVGAVIAKEMNYIANKDTSTLAYPSLICLLCAKEGI